MCSHEKRRRSMEGGHVLFASCLGRPDSERGRVPPPHPGNDSNDRQNLGLGARSQGELDAVEDGLSVSSSRIVDRTPPNTEITQASCVECPKKRFAFAATDVWAANKFQCRMDGGKWTLCSSPREIQVQANGESDDALLARFIGRRRWKSCL